MIKSNVWNRKISEDGRSGILSVSLIFSLAAIAIALLLAGVVGVFDPSIWCFVLSAIITIVILLLRQYELAAVGVLVVQLYVDWYSGLHIVGVGGALVLLVIFFCARSPQYPWVAPRALWLWGLFLLLAIQPAIEGAKTRYDLAYYYPNVIFGALLMFWLGMVIARDGASVRRFFQILAVFGAFLAVITIIQAQTGTLWFATSRLDASLAKVSDYELIRGSDIYRLGSFFINPDWNGTFFAVILFIPLGLFLESSSFLEKVLYLVEMFIILPALLFTFSTGAWLAAIAGIIIFAALVGRVNYRIQISMFIIVAVTVLLLGFSSEISHLFQHGSNSDALAQRNGAWSTAIRVIQAHPLTGIGLGLQNYLQRAEPYRVPSQVIPLAHPHNSYLELGAMAGLPVLGVFLALILFALWLALRNWAQADRRKRSLLCGGIAAVIVLTINSLSVNGWTLPPLAATGWLILGMISSPNLAVSLNSKDEPK
jgi:O-antigen ligase